MCGIAGYINFIGKNIPYESFQKMVSIMVHRGPDNQGIKIFEASPYVALGSRRLSILDLSPAGNQPMSNKDGTIWIVHNGEIYNFPEIKLELIEKGYSFYTNTDTEVIIQAYEEWGENCLYKFNGMFAFAIWDDRKKQLLIARDRLGEKPLYYSDVNGSLYFASEIKSILTVLNPEIDLTSIQDFLLLQYVPWPRTAFKNIMKLPPAHYLIYDKNGLSIHRYWNIPVNKSDISYNEAIMHFSELLKDSVRLRLISDVPLGIFLSGGIDSSVVSYLVNNLVNNPVNAYTISFIEDSKHFDESNYSKIIAEDLNLTHKLITCTADDAFEKIPKLIWHLDEPVAESLIYPVFELANKAKNEITVALSGEGADEFLYGYRNYSFEKLRKYIPPFPYNYSNFLQGKEDIRLRALGYISSSSLENGFNNWVVCFSQNEIKNIFCNPTNSSSIYHKLKGLLPQAPTHNMDLYPWIDQHFRMVDYILTSRDKMTMAASLELRVPFLDHRLVEFMAGLPWNMKIKNGKEKAILKDSFRHLLPDQIVKRRKKPFSAPISIWLKQLADEFLFDSQLTKDGVLTDRIKEYLPFRNNRAVFPRKLWNILMLEIWYRIYFKGFKF